ncbi:MAG: Druantia anti-phage system protein DruA [Smithella sp.]
MALLSFSASALKCAVRDGWIGWGMHKRCDRLKLIVPNSRFLILPDGHRPNLGSRVLSLFFLRRFILMGAMTVMLMCRRDR